MGPDDDVDLTGFDAFDGARLGFLIDESREHLDDDWELCQPLAEDMEVLLGEHCRRREQRDLLPTHRRLERRPQGELRLAKPDVATQEAIHRTIGLHVGLDFCQRGDLVGSLFKRKGRFELLLPGSVGRESNARPGLSQRIHLEQLVSDVLDHFSRAPSRACPITCAQPVKRRLPLASKIFLDAVEVLDRNKELVALGVFQLEILALRAFRFDEPHPLEASDAVIDVDDELIGSEVERELLGEICGSGARAARRTRRSAQPAEELGIGGKVKPDFGLRTPGADVDVRQFQRGLEIEVEVEVNLRDSRPDATLVEQRPQPLVLFCCEHDCR